MASALVRIVKVELKERVGNIADQVCIMESFSTIHSNKNKSAIMMQGFYQLFVFGLRKALLRQKSTIALVE